MSGGQKILVLGALSRNGLAASHSLVRAGYNIYGLERGEYGRFASYLGNIIYPRTYKKIIFSSLLISYPIKEIESELVDIINNFGIDVIVPTGTAETLIISKLKPSLSTHCCVPVESFEKMSVFHDKGQTMEMSKRLNVPRPKTEFLDDDCSIEALSVELNYPVVLKARKGSGTNGVWYVNNKNELREKYLEITYRQDPSVDIEINDKSRPIVQEYIPGELHDVTAFCVNGEAKCLLTQQRLMTDPLSGGGGIVNITTSNPEMMEYASRFIREIGWNGILEFDFKLDERDGLPKLLEINPKIWGTTWLTISAGFDYPLYLVKSVLGEPVEFPQEYESGLICRWPLSELATWFESPLTVVILIERIKRFFLLFKEDKVIYDPMFLSTKSAILYLFFRLIKKIKLM